VNYLCQEVSGLILFMLLSWREGVRLNGGDAAKLKFNIAYVAHHILLWLI
jgi:hypothetical protein